MFVILILLCTQKTAYEMRIGDWTSDVGSSDLAVAALAAAAEGASAGEHRGPPVYAYCTVRDRQSGTIFSSNAFTIEVGGLALGNKVPSMAVLVSSHGEEDLFGQFIAMVESAGFERRKAWCFAAGSMDLLRQHHAPGNSHRPRDSSRFRNWKPDGDYLIASEAWTSGGARPAAARPPVPTADEVAALERIATEAKSEEHTTEIQSLMRIPYAVFCLQKKKRKKDNCRTHNTR